MSSVELNDLTKAYGDAVAVRGVNVQIKQGELLALLGPSGCGKTTTLRMLAGIVPPDGGRVMFGDRDVTGLAPETRDVGLVFQHYALFPHRSVASNLSFGLRMRGQRKQEFGGAVEAMLERLRLGGLGERLPAELSGGQRQRVALGRALITRPSVLLLDEPLSNLDANLREEMRFYIRDLVTEFGITTIYVTHDQSEALAMADRIAVMMNGEVTQLGPPPEIYRRPATEQVAAFIGVTNLLTGEAVADDGAYVTVSGPWGTARAQRAHRLDPGAPVTISVRPEDITVTAAADGAGSHLRLTDDGVYATAFGQLAQSAYLGNTVDYRIDVSGVALRVQGDPRQPLSAGGLVQVGFSAAATWAVSSETHASPGQSVTALARQA